MWELGCEDSGMWDLGTQGHGTRGRGMRGREDMINKQHLNIEDFPGK